MNKILGKIKTKADGALFDIKEKAKTEGKKKIGKWKDKLPNQDQLKEKLGKYAPDMCAPAKKKKLEAKYNKLKSFLNKAQASIGLAVGALNGLLVLLKIIDKLLKILEAIIKVLNVILKVLKIVIKIAKIVVKFLGGTGTGGLIDIISRLIVKAEYKIKGWSEAVTRVIEWIKKKKAKYITPITKFLNKAIKALNKILGIIAGLIAILELLYLLLLSKCALNQETSGGHRSDTLNSGLGTSGTGANGGGDTGRGDGYIGGSNENEGDQLAALSATLDNGSPEEIMARFAGTGNPEYIHYVEKAGFVSFGYERFNAAIGKESAVEPTTKFGATGNNFSS